MAPTPSGILHCLPGFDADAVEGQLYNYAHGEAFRESPGP